ncbi:multidrug DMT transporter permease [Roseomonas sp. M0104]|uniref:Multidrug DMT transporter permease n=1 Tax=Teichococcus coralli TaxID=2545983 RepID=A0A845BDB6_9PROT|nr:cupredoxin domain-containing protein [Pseudoroseomonas coralli]MXP65111.1 multidrug DMT transporter permease [Pseudoroseomonas coralli]
MSLKRTIRIGYGLVGVLALGVAALGVLDWRQHQRRAAQPEADDAVVVTVTAGACEPDHLEVPAGRVAFRVVNRSDRALEWEILDGVMVIEERENIAPGLSQRVTARLAPGEYAITCGLLSNPRGRLVVRPAAEGTAPAAPDLRELIGPMAEYQVYLTLEGAALAEAAARLAEAGRGPAAPAALAEAQAAYQRLRPAAKLLQADLDAALDARAADFAGGADDPAFTGFRRLALALRDADPTVPALERGIQADATALAQRLGAASVPPDRMLAGAALVAGEAAAAQDPALAGAMLDGVGKVVALLAPPLGRTAPEPAQQATAQLAAARAALAAGDEAGWREAARALAESLTSLRERLGAA